MNRIHLNIKTNLAVFSFPNAFLNFKKQESKKETKKSRHVAIPETLIYNYIQNMSTYMFIYPSFFCKITAQHSQYWA